MKRRTFFQTAFAATLCNSIQALAANRPARILLRSSWQMVNIGDIAHTPGVLALIEKYIPEAEVTLWASGSHSKEVSAMEKRRFPKLTIVKGRIKESGEGSTKELDDALQNCDFLLHGSGPSFVAWKDVSAYHRHIRKPFGIYGITYGGAVQECRELMDSANFIYFRDSISLKKAKTDGIRSPVMEFGPDGAFACDLRENERALTFMGDNGLEPGKFVCCIPRYRNTPYWKIHNKAMSEKDKLKYERSLEMREHDIAPLREAIIKIVKESSLKVLVCPEDMSQMAIGKEIIIDRLPPEILKQVVWRKNFWLTDEALSTYCYSAGLFGLEMHSPIMCIGNGVPAIVCRFKEQSSKGIMWQDIGLGEWLFDFDQDEDCVRMPQAVMKML